MFRNKLKDYVIFHPDEFLTFEQFSRVIRNWERDMSLEEAYQLYRNEIAKLPSSNIQIVKSKNLNKLGFKSKGKYKFGTRDYELFPQNHEIVKNKFPLKSNLKKYQLHKVAPRGTYMIDLMFDGKKVYLVAINVNTRYGMVQLTNIELREGVVLKKNAKSAKLYMTALKKMIDEVSYVNPIRFITGDEERAFISGTSQQFYNQFGIQFIPVPRMRIEGKDITEPLHSSLGLIDRFIRTLRDMLYTAGLNLVPDAVQEMVRQYNNAPHRTLSKYIGFSVSPLMVQIDKDKEEYIVMKIKKENIATKLTNGYYLKPMTSVKIYNEKDVLGKRRRIARPGVVVGYNGLLYKVSNEVNGKNNIDYIPRYKLDFI